MLRISRIIKLKYFQIMQMTIEWRKKEIVKMKTVEMMKRSSICLFNDIVNSRCSTIRSRSCNTSAPEFPIQNPFGSNNGQ